MGKTARAGSSSKALEVIPKAYRKTASAIASELNVSLARGLSEEEVRRHREKHGWNRIESGKSRSWLSFFWAHLTEFVSLLLLFVASIALLAYFLEPQLGHLAEAAIIFTIVLINASVGAYQEHRSDETARKLKELVRTQALVFRDGVYKKVDSEELVPGDIVELKAGDKVPADIRLIEVEDLQIREAVLTGESAVVEKSTGVISEDRPLAERNNMAFMNTHVTRGAGKGIVVATGFATEVGSIAEITTRESGREMPFVAEVQTTARKISYLALVLVVIASLVFALLGEDLYQIFLLAAALIIGAIPAALPVTVTYSLSNAMKKMAEENVLVKSPSLLETLGGVDVICTDKTGTLTQNRMGVKKFFVPPNQVLTAGEFDARQHAEIVRCAMLANEAEEARGEAGWIGDPEDIGLLEFLDSKGLDVKGWRGHYKKEAVLPFSSQRKMVQSLVTFDGRRVRYSKGAPEVILERCDKVLVNGKPEPFTREWKERVTRQIDLFSKSALRNLAFSYKETKSGGVGASTKGDTFLGFVGMWDAPREGVKEAINTCYEAGIEVKMVTGDSKKTAMAVARECGFENIRAVAWGEVKDASDEELERIVMENNVFSRMDPELKMAMVKALHRLGKRVAITGDGVNDVPPMEAADVGVAMGLRGSDIAKDAADIILLDDNFASIKEAIKYGRASLSNVRKVTNYLMTANLFEVVVLFVSSFAGFMPFHALQLLWVNFATDIFPAMSLGVDQPHTAIMKKKPTGKKEKILTKRIWWLVIGIGLKKVIMVLAAFFLVLFFSKGDTVILGIKGDLVLAQTTAFVWLVLSHVVRIVAIRWDEGWKGRKIFVNKWVNYSLVGPLLANLLILYTPLVYFFKAKPLPLWAWGIIALTLGIAIALAIVIASAVHHFIGGYGKTEY